MSRRLCSTGVAMVACSCAALYNTQFATKREHGLEGRGESAEDIELDWEIGAERHQLTLRNKVHTGGLKSAADCRHCTLRSTLLSNLLNAPTHELHRLPHHVIPQIWGSGPHHAEEQLAFRGTFRTCSCV